MPLCTSPRCTNQREFVPVVNVPATGVKRGGGIPLQATLVGSARCRTCIDQVTVTHLLTPHVKHMLSMTVHDDQPPPDWDRAWVSIVGLHSLKLQQLQMKAAQGGHA